jgi:hypothetical protein
MRMIHKNQEKHKYVPVDLKRAPVTAPAPILPRISCFPRMASIDELTPLYKRAKKEDWWEDINQDWTENNDDGPRTPAELPIKVPLLVTEFKTLLIRSLVFDTARGLRAPSRTPHTPPRAKPRKHRVSMW